ncbi:MAG: histone deacetylase family protein [Patescibacteria group bacterium]|nr:histone deacetylase family protein [Patescibacteria group bacterium]
MNLIYNKIFLKHETSEHLENKKRLEVFGDLPETKIKNGDQYLKLVHPEKYIEYIKELSQKEESPNKDTIISKNSYRVACYAVGASIMASKQNDFALVRPPGHHAGFKEPQGFCLFNNIAVAVQKLVNQGKKVFIFDFDGHFGNGTSKIFYESNDVLYLSIHQYPAFPNKGWVNEIGQKQGRGYNINIPLPVKSGDDLFVQSFKDFLPIIKQFKPDIAAVSAGFDGHYADPLLDLNYSINSFYEIGKILSNNFKNIFAVLEGGYNLKYLPKCVYNFISGINQKEIKFKEESTFSDSSIRQEYDKRIKMLHKNLIGYWK